jgi:hypothetical protein
MGERTNEMRSAAMKEPNELGYYWVLTDEEYEVLEWDGFYWLRCGQRSPFNHRDRFVVVERLRFPDESEPTQVGVKK